MSEPIKNEIITFRVEYRFRRITRSGTKKKWSYDHKFQNALDAYEASNIVKQWMEDKLYDGYKRKGSRLEVKVVKVEVV